jgi:hypothetical protein
MKLRVDLAEVIKASRNSRDDMKSNGLWVFLREFTLRPFVMSASKLFAMLLENVMKLVKNQALHGWTTARKIYS